MRTMISSKNKTANAVGGKTARACDNCVRKRARWYCAADDAFLCQSCDSSVHSANPLALRHERVRLISASNSETASSVIHEATVSKSASGPCWHRGFTKKARTKRNKIQKSPEIGSNPFLLVPELGGDETNSLEENEEQLLYRVPIFDPFVANDNQFRATSVNYNNSIEETEAKVNYGAKNLNGFLVNEIDLGEFAADVESLLGRGLEGESCFDMEEALGLTDCSKENNKEYPILEYSDSRIVKLEEEEDDAITKYEGVNQMVCDHERQAGEIEMEMMREPFQLNFEDYDDSPVSGGEEEKKVEVGTALMNNTSGEGNYEYEVVEGEKENKKDMKKKKKKKILLRLDYESVIKAWASQGSPWTTGDRPELDLDECWPDFMVMQGTHGGEVQSYTYGGLINGGNPAMNDGGREARVSRYREKRRTRLFSKKIRYEVRKLNAEKRPRMKGRFVKRASFAPPAFPLLN